MRTLNFNHLYYFWVVARLGGVSAASRELHLTQPTLSTQIKQFERAIGRPLFVRTGREMSLTPTGETVKRHADQIFRVAGEMLEAVAERSDGKAAPLKIGSSESVPKLVVRSILDPLRSLSPATPFLCREGRTAHLLEALERHELDVIITSRPAAPTVDHTLVMARMAESEIAIYGAPALARRYRPGFPSSLAGAPMVLPARGTALRDKLQRWFEANGVEPVVAAEVEDRALVNYLGQGGFGLIPAAVAIEEEIARQFGVERIGIVNGIIDDYYAITDERRLRHPAVSAIFAAARERLVAIPQLSGDGEHRRSA